MIISHIYFFLFFVNIYRRGIELLSIDKYIHISVSCKRYNNDKYDWQQTDLMMSFPTELIVGTPFVYTSIE